MDDLTAIETTYAAIGVAAMILLVVTFIAGEIFDIGHAIFGDAAPDASGGHDTDAPSILSSRIVAASFVGFAAFGLIASSAGAEAWLSILVAFAGMALVAGGTFYGIVKPLYRQQFNSQVSRDTYLDLPATVVATIPSGGFGQVELIDQNQTRVRQQAWTKGKRDIPVGATVKVSEVAPGGVFVSRTSSQKKESQ